jgi:hypothetical protein
MYRLASIVGAAALLFVMVCMPDRAFAQLDPARQPSSSEIERLKFEFHKANEYEKLQVERQKAWISGAALLIPLLLGVFTLYWQSRSAMRLREREANDAFELKAAEIVFEGDNTRATKNKARAMRVLFPDRLPPDFGDDFEPSQFGGPRYDAKVEVFRAACAKVQSPAQVYRVWQQLFPADDWIKPLASGEAGAPKGKDI